MKPIRKLPRVLEKRLKRHSTFLICCFLGDFKEAVPLLQKAIEEGFLGARRDLAIIFEVSSCMTYGRCLPFPLKEFTFLCEKITASNVEEILAEKLRVFF
jgi:hypothetical protein